MSGNKKALAVFLAGMCGVVNAQSIDELSDLNRQVMIADARAKLEKKKEAPAGVPGSPMGPGVPGSPMAAPSGGANSPAAPVRAVAVKKLEKSISPSPVLVAIYGIGGRLITELNDSGFEGKYREGDRTPSGWTVSRIDRRLVAMTRPQSKGRGVETVLLPFGVKLDEPKEKEKEAAGALGGGYSMPPLPASFPMLAK